MDSKYEEKNLRTLNLINMQTLKEVKNAEGLDLKTNDVYSFRFNKEYREKNQYTNHCFDGQFIVKQRENGELYFLDTYWASKHDGFKHRGDHRSMSVSDALKNGHLEYICNLDEVEEIREHDLVYYSDDDLFNLSYQHGCYKFFVKKKGAVRDVIKMERIILEKISYCEDSINSMKRDIVSYKETLQRLKDGDQSVYI